MITRSIHFVVALAVAMLLLAGCGGGGGSSSSGQTTARTAIPSVSVDWPTRTRNLVGPNSALSVKIVLQSVAAGGTSLEIDGNRASNLAAHTETYLATSSAPVGAYTLQATFYAASALGGSVVATASANVAVSNSGALTNADGSTLSQISFTGVVTSVVVATGQQLPIGTPTQLTVSAMDAHGDILALSPGSFSFAVVSGSGNMTVTPDGIATGVASGTATVTASVDGVTSAAATIAIDPVMPSVLVDWPVRTRNLLGPSSALSVSATLTASGASQPAATITGNRSSQLSAHTETYSSTTNLYAGAYTLNATFYSGGSQGGIVVATASAPVAVSNAGVVTNPNGTPLNPIAFTGVVSSVAVASGQTVLIGLSDQLTVSAMDVHGNILALSPGSFSFSLLTGGTDLTLTMDGIATGLNAGSPTVSATVDGVTSPAQLVSVATSVDFTNPGFETPQIPVNTWLADQDASGLVGWTGTRTSASWGFENGSSSWGSTAHSGTQFAFIQYTASMQQTVTGLIAGQQYQVQFWSSARDGFVGGNDPCPLTISENGNVIFGPTTPAGPGQWTQYTSNTFTSDGTPCTFLFQTSNPGYDSTDLLDDVHLVPVSSDALRGKH